MLLIPSVHTFVYVGHTNYPQSNIIFFEIQKNFVKYVMCGMPSNA